MNRDDVIALIKKYPQLHSKTLTELIRWELIQDEPDKEMLNILNKTLELLIKNENLIRY